MNKGARGWAKVQANAKAAIRIGASFGSKGKAIVKVNMGARAKVEPAFQIEAAIKAGDDAKAGHKSEDSGRLGHAAQARPDIDLMA